MIYKSEHKIDFKLNSFSGGNFLIIGELNTYLQPQLKPPIQSIGPGLAGLKRAFYPLFMPFLPIVRI